MKRRAIVQVLEAFALGIALVLTGTLAASAQMISETRQGPSAGVGLSEFLGYVETEAAMPSEVSTNAASDYTLAEALRHEAERLHAIPARWADAAVLHIHSADARGLRDDVALSELFIAGGLFYETGDPEDALTTLEMAGDLSLAQGASADARFAYEHAVELALEIGDQEAAQRLAIKAFHISGTASRAASRSLPESSLEEWRELLLEAVIPSPTVAVVIGGPATAAAPRLDERLGPVSLTVPPRPVLPEIGSAGVVLPAPTLTFQLQAPSAAPDLTDARIEAPDLQPAGVRLVPLPARNLPVSSLTVVPVPASTGAVRLEAPEVQPAPELEEVRIERPELREPPLPALPRL